MNVVTIIIVVAIVAIVVLVAARGRGPRVTQIDRKVVRKDEGED
jgi:hypothetical protein